MGIVELAEACGVTQPAMTQTINEMRRLDLLTSVRSDDRRNRLIALSDHARGVAAALTPVWEAVERAANELDRDLSHSLSQAVDEALAALGRVSFAERIERNL